VSIVDATSALSAEPWLAPIRASIGSNARLEVVDTRFSWIILTQQHAYKIKKPLDIGESRNQTLQNRHRACLDEYWLNQALAPGVYTGVLPITQDLSSRLQLNGKGNVVDWVVKMRRLRHEQNLLYLIETHSLLPNQTALLAESLAKFYHARPPQPDGVDDLLRRLIHRIADAAERLKILLPAPNWDVVNQLQASQRRYLGRARVLLTSRVCDGCIVDGHGELRPEHIFFERRPLIIDCVEYSAELRKLDALDDLSLLVMECERLGRRDVGAEIIAHYVQTTGDVVCAELQAFYKSLHAGSTAVAILDAPASRKYKSNGQSFSQAIDCLTRAADYAARLN
jgi:aminoglycoside phosphotransferase family enzyme